MQLSLKSPITSVIFPLLILVGTTALPRSSGAVSGSEVLSLPRSDNATASLCTETASPPSTEKAIISDGLLITIETLMYSIGAETVILVVQNKHGEKVSGALVFITIRMPAMDHGDSAYPAWETSGGRFQAREVSFGMSGEWIITVEVIRQARSPVVARFAATVSAN